MKLTPLEQRTAVTIAGIYGLRMFGLFLVMPVLFIYAQDLNDYTPALAGLAIGIYGLGQAILQIPLGYLSDRLGRKPIIIFGLIVFALGSFVAAESDTMMGLVFGRALQGAGAIASTLMAFVSDLSRPEVRSKLMASIGATIGVSFVLSMVLGPWLTSYIGVSGLFYLTMGLSLFAILVVLFIVPKEQRHGDNSQVLPVKEQLRNVVSNRQLQLMNFGIFLLHMILTAVFVVLPGQLIDLGIPLKEHSVVYLVLMVASFLMMIPLMIWTEKKHKHPQGVSLAALLLLIAMLGLFLSQGLYTLIVSVGLFFIGFNFLEASIPAIVSRLCPTAQRGTAMGFYSTSQFSGAFIGGSVAGLIVSYWQIEVVYLCLGGLTAVWLMLVLRYLRPLAKKPQASG